MKGKICIVTGASAGIGKITARELAKKGATVVIVCRDKARGEAALAEIKSGSGSEAVTLMLCDFASQRSIRAVAKDLLEKHPKIDVLVNNAGAINGTRILTEDGIESTFAVNHLGYFLLTDLLLEALKAAAPSRIVNVASSVHTSGKIDLGDTASSKGYSSFGAYAGSKLANLAFTFELARKLEGTGVTANCLHPGVIASNFGASGGALLRGMLVIGRLFMISPDRGAETSVYLASSPDVEGVSGKYFTKKRQTPVSKAASDPELARALWSASEKLVSASAEPAAVAS